MWYERDPGIQRDSLEAGYITAFAVILRTADKNPWVNEFDYVELSCLIESISTSNPRIEWKKIENGKTRALKNRAVLRQPATLVITNATRSDTAKYRCEVVAIEDEKSFDEILINLVVRGKAAELSCVEEEGFPKSKYLWFRNDEAMPEDPKTSPKFLNSSYTLNPETGSLKFGSVRKEDEGEYYCRAVNDAGYSECGPQMLEVYHINILLIVLGSLAVGLVLLCVTVGLCCAYKQGFLPSEKEAGSNYASPERGDGVDYARTDEEGDFRHKSSFVI
ncbi:hypothetical protein JZ751_002332 [Albula glossodonta]|uniref:Ig-like domain-containing protein n=1 Tax=Albula glossodonta TaxID=121402 RepID=A0A8T2P7M6_9TELE|nr:hypothetical protein JZ751_002332 [Albula glossodonta]